MKNLQLKKRHSALGLLGALAISVSSVQANTSEAQRFVCDHSGEVREVSVIFGPNKQLPCKVMYKKNGKEKTLWRARYDEKFCGVRAQELVAELEGGGWSCSLAEPMPVADKAPEGGKADKEKAAMKKSAKEKSSTEKTAMEKTTMEENAQEKKSEAKKAVKKKAESAVAKTKAAAEENAEMAQTPKADPAKSKTPGASDQQ